MVALEARLQRLKGVSPVRIKEFASELNLNAIKKEVTLRKKRRQLNQRELRRCKSDSENLEMDNAEESSKKDGEDDCKVEEAGILPSAGTGATKAEADSEDSGTDDEESGDFKSGSSELDEDDVVSSESGAVLEVTEVSEMGAPLLQGNKEPGVAGKSNFIGDSGDRSVAAHQVLDDKSDPRISTSGSVNVVPNVSEFFEEDLQNLKKGYQDIFIKENLEETSTTQQPAAAQPEHAESAENSALPKEW
ncbi:hypothetical protein U1Q18_027864, partial [Sarracenia purpurea var. burkii]